MGKSIVMNKTREELLDLGFEDYGKHGYLLKVSENRNDKFLSFFETIYGENELVLEITDASFPDHENAYENLYNFILENKNKNNSFWSYDRILASGYEIKDRAYFYLDSLSGEIVHQNEKRKHMINISKHFKETNELLEDRTFYPISNKYLVEPLIKLSEHIKLVDLDLKYKEFEQNNDFMDR